MSDTSCPFADRHDRFAAMLRSCVTGPRPHSDPASVSDEDDDDDPLDLKDLLEAFLSLPY